VCSGCERRRSGRRARFSPSAQGMFPWINTIFAYPTVRRDIRRGTPISGARSRRGPGLLPGGGDGRRSASYAIIVGRVPSARSSCDVTRRPYCAPSWTRSVIAIKKCDSHTWRRSRGFDRGVRKTGARRGERRLAKEQGEGGCAKIRAAADHARSLPATVAGRLRCARASVHSFDVRIRSGLSPIEKIQIFYLPLYKYYYTFLRRNLDSRTSCIRYCVFTDFRGIYHARFCQPSLDKFFAT